MFLLVCSTPFIRDPLYETPFIGDVLNLTNPPSLEVAAVQRAEMRANQGCESVLVRYEITICRVCVCQGPCSLQDRRNAKADTGARICHLISLQSHTQQACGM